MTRLQAGLIVSIAILAAAALVYRFRPQPAIVDFASCAAAGYPVQETYPERCVADGRTYVREVPDIGVLTGQVTVGPICPVERVDQSCPVPPEAYTSRSVSVGSADGSFFTSTHFSPDGAYRFELPPGSYVVSLPASAVGGSKDLPRTVNIFPDVTTTLDFSIDTGIR